MEFPTHRPLQSSDLPYLYAPFEDLKDLIRTEFPDLSDDEVLNFDYSVRLMLHTAKDNSVILAPGDSPSRMIMYANLCFVHYNVDLRSGFSTYVFPWKGKLLSKRIRFINFPLSGVSGYRWDKDISWQGKLQNYIRQVVQENHLEDVPLSFFDFICGNTFVMVTKALGQIRSGFQWVQKLNVCELACGQDILTWRAELGDCRGISLYKEYDQPIPAHNYTRCNLMVSWCYHLNQRYQEFESYRRCLVEFEYPGTEGQTRRVVVLKYVAPDLIGIDVHGSFQSEEFNVRKISNLRVITEYPRQVRRLEKVAGHLAEVEYLWGRSYTLYYPKYSSYITSYVSAVVTTREEVLKYLGPTVQVSLLIDGVWVPRTGKFKQWNDSGSDQDHIWFIEAGRNNSYPYSDFRDIRVE